MMWGQKRWKNQTSTTQIFCARLKYRKSGENRHHSGLASSSEGMGLVTLWRQIKNSQSRAISIGAIFLLSSRRCAENCRPFVLLRDVVAKETNHKTYHYIIQHFLTTSDQRQSNSKQSGSLPSTRHWLDTKLDAFYAEKVSDQTIAFCVFPMIQRPSNHRIPFHVHYFLWNPLRDMRYAENYYLCELFELATR